MDYLGKGDRRKKTEKGTDLIFVRRFLREALFWRLHETIDKTLIFREMPASIIIYVISMSDELLFDISLTGTLVFCIIISAVAYFLMKL